jgi:pyocin large subunit-like protein
MTSGRRLVAWCLAATLLLGALAGCGRAKESSTRTTATSTQTPSASAITRPDVGFRSTRRWDEHFAKHGREFKGVDREGYLKLAQTLRDAPVSETVIEITRSDRTITRFDRASGAFLAFERDGIIRTFFRPNDGEAYFRRQARR